MTDYMPLDALCAQSIRVITEALRDEVCVVAWSGGKDSTIVLSHALTAWEVARDNGWNPCPIFVIHGNTLVENPAMVTYAKEAMDSIAAVAEARGIDVRIQVYEPTPVSSWPVRIIGGALRPVYQDTGDRWCSKDWKVRPANRMIKTIVPELRAEIEDALLDPRTDAAERERLMAQRLRISDARMPVTLLGTRYDESARRAANMSERGESALAISEHFAEGRLVSRSLSPIAEMDTWQVLEWYSLAEIDHADPGLRAAMDLRPLIDIYRDANDGTCSLMPGSDHSRKACGARTGCWACTAVGTDRSMLSFLAEPRYHHLRGLAAVRDWLDALQHDHTARRLVTRDLADGMVRIQPDGLSAATLKTLLRVILTIDRREALRARAFDAAIAEGRMPDDPYMAQLAAEGREDPAYVERMRQPQFQTVQTSHIPLIEAYWALYGISTEGFEAARIFHEVIVQGIECEVPVIAKAEKAPVPAPRYIDLTVLDGDPKWGLNDPMTEWCEAVSPGAIEPLGPTAGLTEIEVDPEKASRYVFDIVPQQMIATRGRPSRSPFLPLAILGQLIRSGTIRMPARMLGEWERMAQRSQLLRNAGLYGAPDLTDVPMVNNRRKTDETVTGSDTTAKAATTVQADLFARIPSVAA